MRVCDRCRSERGVQEYVFKFELVRSSNPESAIHKDLCASCATFFKEMGHARSVLSFLANTDRDWLLPIKGRPEA